MESLETSEAAEMTAHQQTILALLIDPEYYAEQIGIGSLAAYELAGHYARTGWRCGVNPTRTFHSSLYADAVAGRGCGQKNPFVHYLFEEVGEDALAHALDGLSAADVGKMRGHFDADWYRNENADIDWTLSDPFVHYLASGWRERRDPSPAFSTGFYLDLYADIRDCGINPFRHWVLYGIEEGRSSGRVSAAPWGKLDSWESLSDSQRLILRRIFDLPYYQSHIVDADSVPGRTLAERASSASTGAAAASPSFCPDKYLMAHPELRQTGQVPFLHYLFAVVGEDALRELFVAPPPSIAQAVCEQFDAAWYLYSSPDIEASGEDAFIHYMTAGWRERRDPSQQFSTKAYLLRYADIVEAGVNPFLHWITYGQAEGRLAVSSASNFRNRAYSPSITAVLINSEGDPVTPNCITAVRHQTYDRLKILVVGAPLSDACQAALKAEAGESWRYSHVPQDASLPLWRLLECAVGHADGDLVWFVQERGVYHAEFVARLTSSFADGSVQLGFGRRLRPGDADYAVGEEELARRMEGWAQHLTTPAALWFSNKLETDLPAEDRPSFLWRRRPLGKQVWERAGGYRVLGIWYLYLQMASGGQIATVRDAITRIPPAVGEPIHGRDDADLHRDKMLLDADVRSFWSTTRPEGSKRHILIVTHGIFAGGAENLPIQMANALVARGVIVSLLIFKTELNPEMRATLNPGVSIYEADWVMEYGCEAFLRDIGCSLIHSHGVIGEMFFFRLCEEALPVPYVATLHGSYENSSSTELPEQFIAKIVQSVDLFVYTADKNLVPLVRNGVRPEQLIKMSNAMPIDRTPFPQSRSEMGIAEDAIVFTLVARGIKEKGWSTAINALKAVQRRNPGRPMHLCLVGEGDEPDRLQPLYADDSSISFLGFQLRIHGLYRMSDVAIVPTRFAGESYPLCIIQALQASIPVIATNVGEIASMLEVDGVAGGLLVESTQSDTEFDARFSDAMHELMFDERRRELAHSAGLLAKAYDMDAFIDQYAALYEDVLKGFAERRRSSSSRLHEQGTVDA